MFYSVLKVKRFRAKDRYESTELGPSNSYETEQNFSILTFISLCGLQNGTEDQKIKEIRCFSCGERDRSLYAAAVVTKPASTSSLHHGTGGCSASALYQDYLTGHREGPARSPQSR